MGPFIRWSLGATFLAIVAGGGILLATTRGEPLDTNVGPRGMDTRLELSKGEEIRTVELYPDRITAKHSVATHGDGSITNYWYRPDGTIEKAITEGPADADGKRAQRRYAEIATDGFTYLHDIEYSADGVKSKETVLRDGKQVRSYFHNNGVERRNQVIVREKKGWRLAQEDLFREDASLAESLRNTENGAWERKFFNENSVLVSSKAMGAFGSRYTEVTYYPDGVTKASLMEQNGQGTKLTTYRSNGSREEERTWSGPVSGANIQVAAYDLQDRQVYQQWWSFADGKHYLWLVKTFRADKSLAKAVYFERNSKEATEISYKGDGEYGGDYTRRRFRAADGTLALEEDEVANKVVATREFSPAQKITLQLPAEYTTLKEVPPLSQVIPYAPAPMGGM
jgi:antitoxin component YwqK of YwqJK toxin-antitoxin module